MLSVRNLQGPVRNLEGPVRNLEGPVLNLEDHGPCDQDFPANSDTFHKCLLNVSFET